MLSQVLSLLRKRGASQIGHVSPQPVLFPTGELEFAELFAAQAVVAFCLYRVASCGEYSFR